MVQRVVPPKFRDYTVQKGDVLKKAAEGFGLPRADDLLAQIGYGKLGARQVLDALVPAGQLKEKAPDHPVVSAVKRVLLRDDAKAMTTLASTNLTSALSTIATIATNATATTTITN